MTGVWCKGRAVVREAAKKGSCCIWWEQNAGRGCLKF